jgi:hypothetical protein
VGIAVGVVVLVVATAATAAGAYALQQHRTAGRPQHVTDAQGLSYDVPAGWTAQQEEPVTQWADDGEVVASFANYDADGSTDAAHLLAVLDPPVCDDDPETIAALTGAETTARCTDAGEAGDVTTVAAVAAGQLWVVTLQPAATEAEQRRVLDSIDLTG